MRPPRKRQSPNQTKTVASHLGQTTVSRQGDQIQLALSASDGRTVTIALAEDDAQQIGTALLGMCGAPTEQTDLFAMVPLMIIVNPPFELQRSDTGQIIVALKTRTMRPIFVQFDRQEAVRLKDTLASVLV